MMVLFIALFLARADEVWDRVKTHLEKKTGDYTSHRVSRIGDQTFELETFISAEGDLESASRIFSDYRHYKRWVLKNINKRPQGGEFFVKVIDVKYSDPDRIHIVFDIAIGNFHHSSERVFSMKAKRLPDRFILEGQTLLDASSLVSSGSGAITVFLALGKPNRLWVYIRGHTQIRSKLLYTLLPDAALRGEAGHRIQTAIQNFSDWDIARSKSSGNSQGQ